MAGGLGLRGVFVGTWLPTRLSPAHEEKPVPTPGGGRFCDIPARGAAARLGQECLAAAQRALRRSQKGHLVIATALTRPRRSRRNAPAAAAPLAP